MINATLNVFDAGFSALEKVEEFDYIALGDKVIQHTATFAAVVVAVVTYVVTALQLFWLDNGTAVMTNAMRFTFNLVDAVGATYYAGVNLRPVVNRWVATLVDGVYYFAAGV